MTVLILSQSNRYRKPRVPLLSSIVRPKYRVLLRKAVAVLFFVPTFLRFKVATCLSFLHPSTLVFEYIPLRDSLYILREETVRVATRIYDTHYFLYILYSAKGASESPYYLSLSIQTSSTVLCCEVRGRFSRWSSGYSEPVSDRGLPASFFCLGVSAC